MFPTSSFTSIIDQPPDHTFHQQDMVDVSAMLIHKWNIVAIYVKDLWNSIECTFKKWLRKASSVRESVVAIIKASCDYPTTAGTLYLPTDLLML